MGDKPERALQKLTEIGLKGVIRDQPDCRATGAVIRTDPGKEQVVIVGTTVTVYVSSAGDQSSIVPRVIGLSIRDAEGRLRSAGLGIRTIRTQPSDSVPPDTVIQQRPDPEQRLASGCSVDVVVSVPMSSSPLSRVPSLIGLKINEAWRRLASAGLIVGKVNEVDSGREPPGTVLQQSPMRGASVPKGTPVDLVVARSRAALPTPTPTPTPGALVTVPDVVGKKVSQATSILTQAGLTYEVIEAISTIGKSFPDSRLSFEPARFKFEVTQAKRVVRQDPTAGTRVRRGTRVLLWVR